MKSEAWTRGTPRALLLEYLRIFILSLREDMSEGPGEPVEDGKEKILHNVARERDRVVR